MTLSSSPHPKKTVIKIRQNYLCAVGLANHFWCMSYYPTSDLKWRGFMKSGLLVRPQLWSTDRYYHTFGELALGEQFVLVLFFDNFNF